MKLRKLADLSHDTLAKAKVVLERAEKAPEAVKAKLRTGATTINAAFGRSGAGTKGSLRRAFNLTRLRIEE